MTNPLNSYVQQASGDANMTDKITIERPKETYSRRGRCRSSHHQDISAGLFPPPILIGDRAVGTPSHETDIMIAAQMAGKTKAELRELVKKLVANRKKFFDRWQS